MMFTSSSFPWWLSILYSRASSLLLATSLVTFGYVIPALSSIKAVVHRDPEAYTQWVSYWLILRMLNLMDSATPPWWGGEPSWLRVPLLLWLSLPKYRGASVLYGAAVAPFLRDFDHVERRVDGRIGELWLGAWAFGSSVARRVIVAALTAGWAGRGGAGPNDGRLGLMAMMAWWGYSGGGGRNEAREEDEDCDEGGEEEEEERRLSPHHSLRWSSTSLVAKFDSSRTSETADAEEEVDDDDNAVDDDGYAEDFANLLSRGLYVFALEGDDGGGAGGGGTFKLRVLSYRPGDEGEQGGGVSARGGVLVLSRVDRRGGGGRRRGANEEDDRDRVVVPLRDVESVEPSGSRNVSLNLVSSSSSVVELMLSDGEDRDTLLAGLRALNRRGCRRRPSSVDDVSGVDDGDDADEEDANSSSVVPNRHHPSDRNGTGIL